MSDTPETDSEHQARPMGGFTLDFCRQLERERDEAREQRNRLAKISHNIPMTDTPETDQCVKDNKHIKFLEEDHWSLNGQLTYTHPIVSLSRKLERERDEAVRSCHIWQTGHAELVRLNQPERKHIGRWGSGSNKEFFTSPYIVQ